VTNGIHGPMKGRSREFR